eukprot:1047496-Pelagomonas_calceolata.AAC.1
MNRALVQSTSRAEASVGQTNLKLRLMFAIHEVPFTSDAVAVACHLQVMLWLWHAIYKGCCGCDVPFSSYAKTVMCHSQAVMCHLQVMLKLRCSDTLTVQLKLFKCLSGFQLAHLHGLSMSAQGGMRFKELVDTSRALGLKALTVRGVACTGRKGKSCIAIPASEGSLAAAKSRNGLACII